MESSGMSTRKIVKVAVGCVLAGLIVGYGAKFMWRKMKSGWTLIQRRLRPRAESIASIGSRSIPNTSRTTLSTMVPEEDDDNMRDVPVYEIDDFMRMDFSVPVSKKNPVLFVEHPVEIHPQPSGSRAGKCSRAEGRILDV